MRGNFGYNKPMPHLALQQQAHRPYPVPSKPWALSMDWQHLLFMHYPVAPALLQPLLPAGLELDLYEGDAWLGIVPFTMRNVRPRCLPVVSGLSDFPELNVRTYVRASGKAGVWFFSLDAHSALAVKLARWGFYLPYFRAEMSSLLAGNKVYDDDAITREVYNAEIHYESIRRQPGAADARFLAFYQPLGEVFQAQPGSLEHFLTERYCLYSCDPRGRLWRADIQHQPWPLQLAEAQVEINTMGKQLGFNLPMLPPLLHFAEYLEVIAWLPEKLERS